MLLPASSECLGSLGTTYVIAVRVSVGERVGKGRERRDREGGEVAVAVVVCMVNGGGRDGKSLPARLAVCSVVALLRLTLSLDTNTWRREPPRSQTVNDVGAPLLRCESELLQVVDSLDAAQVLGYQVPRIEPETVGELRLGGARFLCSGKCFLTIYFSCGALASCALCAKTNLGCRGFCGRGSFAVVQSDFFVWLPCADVSSPWRALR